MNLPSMSMFDNWMGGDKKPAQPAANGTGNQPNGGVTDPNQETNLENNTGTNNDLITQLWDEEKAKPGSEGNPLGNQPPNNPNPPAGPAAKTDEQLRSEISTHLGSVGLGDIALSAADVEKLQGENSHQEFANLINTRIQQAYLQSMQSAQRLMRATLDTELPRMVEEAVNKSKSFFEGDRLRSVLKTDDFLKPLMDDPATAPVVETVMRQFIVKGANKDKATQLTRDYFQRVRKAMDPDYTPPSTNTRTTFRGNPRTAINFLDVLKGN